MNRPTLALLVAALLPSSLSGQVVSRRPTVAYNPLPAATCPAPRDSAYDAMIVVPHVSRSARTALITVCVSAPAAYSPLKRIVATVTFTAPLASFDTASQIPGATRTITNASAGTMRFTASNASGIPAGAQVVMRVRLLRPGELPQFTLAVTELKAANGRSVLDNVWIQGVAPIRATRRGGPQRPPPRQEPPRLEPPPQQSAPFIVSLDRATIASRTLAAGNQVVEIRGEGFDAVNNTVVLGSFTISGLGSDQGRRIQFTVPTPLITPGRIKSAGLPAGDYQITVRTPRGTSNAVKFTVTP